MIKKIESSGMVNTPEAVLEKINEIIELVNQLEYYRMDNVLSLGMEVPWPRAEEIMTDEEAKEAKANMVLGKEKMWFKGGSAEYHPETKKWTVQIDDIGDWAIDDLINVITLSYATAKEGSKQQRRTRDKRN